MKNTYISAIYKTVKYWLLMLKFDLIKTDNFNNKQICNVKMAIFIK